jgi:hypothetical protein
MAKATLWEQLNKIFPEVLPTEAPKAINGTQLIALVKPKLVGDFTENAIRGYFSFMSKDPSTTIAKKSDGQGYYLRNLCTSLQPA